jgi:uncharacterized protein (DUF58 family)
MDRATVLVLALISLLVRGGERVALLGAGHAPVSGRNSLRRIAHELIDVPSNERALPPEGQISRKAQFVWVSDFLTPLPEIELTMRRLASAEVTGQLVHIVDPAEEDFPFEGRTRFEALQGADHALFGRAESVRSGYRARFAAHAEAIALLARRFGWMCLAHRTDKNPELALIALYAAIGGDVARRSA